MKTQAIIPTAGIGTRLKTDLPKPLVLLNDKPLFIHTLEAFEQSHLIDSIILVAHEEYTGEFERIIKQFRLQKINKIVVGGQDRCESVYKGLCVTDQDTEVVVIHDGARPLVNVQILDEAIKLCGDHQAVVVAVPVKQTIKRVDQKVLFVDETLNRDELWEIQTPQVFKKDILIKAHQQRKESNPTDDAHLVEKLGIKVKVLKGDYKNIKITTREDLSVAKALLLSKT